MKKATELKNWIERLIEKLIPSEKKDLKENENQIMNLLFYSNFNELTIQETLELKIRIDNKFDDKVSKHKEKVSNELDAIRKFKYPACYKPLSEIEVSYQEVVFDRKN